MGSRSFTVQRWRELLFSAFLLNFLEGNQWNYMTVVFWCVQSMLNMLTECFCYTRPEGSIKTG